MRRLGELAAASESGYRCGLERRQPDRLELERFRSGTLWSAFTRGQRRGRKARAVLQQLEIPGTSPDGVAGRYDCGREIRRTDTVKAAPSAGELTGGDG